MKGIKKLLALILCAIITFAIIGCSNNNDNKLESYSGFKSAVDLPSSENEKPSGASNWQGATSSQSGNTSSLSQGDTSSSQGTQTDEKPVYKLVNLNYNETTDFVLNPGRGFYYDMHTNVPKTGGKALFNTDWVDGEEIDHFGNPLATWDGGWKDEVQSYVHICFDLPEFSAKMGGQDILLTDDALKSINLTLDNLRASKMSATVRFSYDPDGIGYKQKKDVEPPLEMVLKHVEQVAKIVSQYQDCIYSIDTGFLGPWGEQHTTSLGIDTNVNAYYQLLETWLKNTNSDMNLMVRKPLLFLNWYNMKYGTNYTTSNIDTVKETEDSMRISCYNDGYLASASDYGTFTNREKEIKWLSTRKGMYGGEVEVENVSNLYATGARMVTESFITHTTHLNYFYNQEVIKSNSKGTAWKQQKYGVGLDNALIDPLYKDLTYYKYIENHLGYRLVLRKSEINENAKAGEKLYLKGDIENVGFAPITTNKNVYVVLVCGDKIVYSKVDFDVKSIASKLTKSYEFTAQIPSNFSGEVSVYLKISSVYDKTQEENKRQVAFANAGNQYNENLGANLIAEFTA